MIWGMIVIWVCERKKRQGWLSFPRRNERTSQAPFVILLFTAQYLARESGHPGIIVRAGKSTGTLSPLSITWAQPLEN